MDDPKSAASRPSVEFRPSLLDRYQAVAATSRAMVEAARAQNWTEVGQLERKCIVQVHELKRAAFVLRLGTDEQPTRVQLLRSILADDAEIRRLAEPWLVELEHLLMPGDRPTRE